MNDTILLSKVKIIIGKAKPIKRVCENQTTHDLAEDLGCLANAYNEAVDDYERKLLTLLEAL